MVVPPFAFIELIASPGVVLQRYGDKSYAVLMYFRDSIRAVENFFYPV